MKRSANICKVKKGIQSNSKGIYALISYGEAYKASQTNKILNSTIKSKNIFRGNISCNISRGLKTSEPVGSMSVHA